MESTPFFQGKSSIFKLLFLLLLVVFGFSLFNILGIVLVEQIWGVNQMNSSSNAIRLVLFLSSLGAFFLPGYFYLFLESNNCGKSNKWNPVVLNQVDPKNQQKNALIVILISVFIIPVIGIIGDWNQKMGLPSSFHNIELWMKEMEETNSLTIKNLTSNPDLITLIMNFIVMALVPAIAEEFFFRGAIQHFLSSVVKNKHIVVIITAFIFSVIHFQFYGFIPRFILGIYLGYLAIWSGKLFLPILAHFMHNSLSLLFDYLSKQNHGVTEEVTMSQIPGIVPIFLISLAIVIFGIYKINKSQKTINALKC